MNTVAILNQRARFLGTTPGCRTSALGHVAFSMVVLLAAFSGRGRAGAPPVTILKTPDEGIQPQAVMDAKGVLHLLYFKGDPAGGDLYYVRRISDKQHFADPIRVNSQPGSATAVGTIRGGQLAVGKGG